MSADEHAPPNLRPPEGSERKLPYGDDDSRRNPEALAQLVRDRYEEGVGAFEENRRMHSEDLNFVYNAETQGQWDPIVLEARKGKPCYTFNRVLTPVNQVVADMRQTRPAGKVRPTGDGATQAVADILAGLCRSIEKESRASAIYKTQYKFSVAGGFGAWRILPVYAGDMTFNQVLRLFDIPNPQTVVWDPECNDPCAGDAMWCLIGDRISRDKYKVLYPRGDETNFSFSRDSYGWFTDKEVRVAEYYERVPFEKTIARLSNGDVIDYTDSEKAVEAHLEKHGITDKQAGRVVETRKVVKWRVMWVKCDGANILEGPNFYDWKRIPVVRVPGRYINIEGRKKLQSLIRHSKDAQRSYNSRVSDMIERSALTPKAPYLVTAAMVKGYEREWAQANTSARPYLPFNIDPAAAAAGIQGGAPERAQPIDPPVASTQLAQVAAGDIQATTGFFDPALGNAEDMNRVSGKALIQHTRRSDLGSYEFIDGFQDALQLTWEMEIDMIPTIYDSERIVQIVGQDDIEKEVTVNQEQGETGTDLLNDLKKGTYGCTVTIGPSFQTQRQETLATLIDAAGAIPAIASVAPDILAKNMDTPDADELSKRLRTVLIKQGIVQPTQQEQKEGLGQTPPNPMQQAQMQLFMAKLQREQANATIAGRKAQSGELDLHKMIVDVAGRHLANLIAAKQLGEPSEADAAEAEAAQEAQPPQQPSQPQQ